MKQQITWLSQTYIDGLCKSLQSVCIGSPVKFPRPKRRLSEILDFEDETESDTETTIPPTKKSRVTSQMASASNKNKKKHKKTKKH